MGRTEPAGKQKRDRDNWPASQILPSSEYCELSGYPGLKTREGSAIGDDPRRVPREIRRAYGDEFVRTWCVSGDGRVGRWGARKDHRLHAMDEKPDLLGGCWRRGLVASAEAQEVEPWDSTKIGNVGRPKKRDC